MKKKRAKHRAKTRVVSFKVVGLAESVSRAVLEAAKTAGWINQYGTDEQFCWFEGTPGEDMRSVKRALIKLGGKSEKEDPKYR